MMRYRLKICMLVLYVLIDDLTLHASHCRVFLSWTLRDIELVWEAILDLMLLYLHAWVSTLYKSNRLLILPSSSAQDIFLTIKAPASAIRININVNRLNLKCPESKEEGNYQCTLKCSLTSPIHLKRLTSSTMREIHMKSWKNYQGHSLWSTSSMTLLLSCTISRVPSIRWSSSAFDIDKLSQDDDSIKLQLILWDSRNEFSVRSQVWLSWSIKDLRRKTSRGI